MLFTTHQIFVKNFIYYTPNICNCQATAQCDVQCLDMPCKRAEAAFLQQPQNLHVFFGEKVVNVNVNVNAIVNVNLNLNIKVNVNINVQCTHCTRMGRAEWMANSLI